MNTLLRHPLIDEYAEQLRRATVGLSAERVDEVRTQVREHLLDSLSPDPTDAQVAQVLAELGPARNLIGAPPADDDPVTFVGWLTTRSRRWWAVFLALACIAATVTTVVATETHVTKIQSDCLSCMFVSATDRRNTSFGNDDISDDYMSAPLRYGAQQGVLFEIINPSRFSKTVRGALTEADHNFGAESVSFSRFDVLTSGEPVAGPGGWRPVLTVPPGGRAKVLVRVRISACEETGKTVGLSTIALTVHAIGFTWTETVKLTTTFPYTASKASGRCHH